MFLCACVNYVNKLIPIKSAMEHSLKIGFFYSKTFNIRETVILLRKYVNTEGIITEWKHLLTREKKSSNLEKIDKILTSVIRARGNKRKQP